MTLEELKKRFTGNGTIQPGAGEKRVKDMLSGNPAALNPSYDNGTGPKYKTTGTTIDQQIKEQRAKVLLVRQLKKERG
jgi:hypothetical protein